MTGDFWKKFPVIPGFDCLKMKHDIQAKIHEETKHMTQAERLEYYRAGAKKMRRRSGALPEAAAPVLVTEEPAPYGKNLPRKD